MELCEKIKQARTSQGITKTFVAKQLGLSLQAYRYIESGETQLTVSRLIKLAEILREPISFFLENN